MNLIVTAVVLAALAALMEWWVGIAQPWKNIIVAGVVIIFIVGVLMILGLLPFRW